MVGVGNHDMFYDAVAFSSRYKMPQSSALGSQGNMWYAYDYGNSHWVRSLIVTNLNTYIHTYMHHTYIHAYICK